MNSLSKRNCKIELECMIPRQQFYQLDMPLAITTSIPKLLLSLQLKMHVLNQNGKQLRIRIKGHVNEIRWNKRSNEWLSKRAVFTVQNRQ